MNLVIHTRKRWPVTWHEFWRNDPSIWKWNFCAEIDSYDRNTINKDAGAKLKKTKKLHSYLSQFSYMVRSGTLDCVVITKESGMINYSWKNIIILNCVVWNLWNQNTLKLFFRENLTGERYLLIFCWLYLRF